MIRLNDEVLNFGNYPNKEIKIDEEQILTLLKRGGANQIFFKYEDDSDLMKLYLLKHYLDDLSKDAATFFELIIAYMPYSRMDRREKQSAFTLKYISILINSMKFKNVFIVEPHSDVSCALIDNSQAIYVNFHLLHYVMKEVEFNKNEDYLMFPDAGAAKRYAKMKANNVIIGNKERDFTTGEIKGFSLHSDFKGSGKKVIIVDDLSSYGGTFVKSAEALREKGFEEIYLLVAHSENSIFKGKLFENVNRVFTTDSLITEQKDWNNAKFLPQLKIYELKEVL